MPTPFCARWFSHRRLFGLTRNRFPDPALPADEWPCDVSKACRRVSCRRYKLLATNRPNAAIRATRPSRVQRPRSRLGKSASANRGSNYGWAVFARSPSNARWPHPADATTVRWPGNPEHRSKPHKRPPLTWRINNGVVPEAHEDPELAPKRPASPSRDWIAKFTPFAGKYGPPQNQYYYTPLVKLKL